MTLVLRGVQRSRSVDASITLVRPASPLTKSNAPSFEYSVILTVGAGIKTATTLLWLNRVGRSAQFCRAVPRTPSIRKLSAELLAV